MRKINSELLAVVEKWNESFPIGTPVLYTPVAGWGETRIEYTRSRAAIAAGESPVVWITGHLCAMAIAWLKPMPELPARRAPVSLLRALHAFRELLLVHPLVTVNRAAVHAVVCSLLDAQPPDFTVCTFDELEGYRHLGYIRQPEGIQQISDLLRWHNALDALIRLRLHSELCSERIWRAKLAKFHRRRRRWRR